MLSVTLDNISRRFGAFVAVDGVSLHIERGEFVTLLGPSGCGKTTTLRMVAGLETNDAGCILIGDRVVNDPQTGHFVPPERRNLGMVFQSYAIWPHMTVFDNVAYPLRVRRVPRAELRNKVLETLRLVEMDKYADRAAPALSGGQQQRVAIARALVAEPAVLLLDEPLSNLDARLRAQMGDEFRAIQKLTGITTLYVTHDQDEAMALSDRVVVMKAGRILQVGAPETIYQRPASRSVAEFFGNPNLFEATVSACHAGADGRFQVTAAGRTWSGTCFAGDALQPGTAVLVMVRPENLKFQPLGQSVVVDEFHLTGEVKDFVFRGAQRSVTVNVDGRMINVVANAFTPVAIGERVHLTASTFAAWAFPVSSQG